MILKSNPGFDKSRIPAEPKNVLECDYLTDVCDRKVSYFSCYTIHIFRPSFFYNTESRDWMLHSNDIDNYSAIPNSMYYNTNIVGSYLLIRRHTDELRRGHEASESGNHYSAVEDIQVCLLLVHLLCKDKYYHWTHNQNWLTACINFSETLLVKLK